MALEIDNRTARWLWLHSTGLGNAPVGKLNLLQLVKDLGFVQLDTIRNVTRAQHHILWSRNQNYREPMLNNLLGKQRKVFEHYTHDASVIPVEFYPMWQRQFSRMKEKIDRLNYYPNMPDEKGRQTIKARIAKEGPLSTHAFDTKVVGTKKMWSRPPHKMALDYMWYCGELATSHRENFKKFYDLSERVIPDEYREVEYDDEHQIDWLCKAALERLSFGTVGDVQRFWDATTSDEVRQWAGSAGESLVEVKVGQTDKSWGEVFAVGDIEQR
ncbi:MAG TPA: winged helix-turn-helix domain-containing protein, partial [Rhizobiales bacterium]|nr:winged helix-turn-helix domain-containing protein [Hyphomicrobiales bacterium]